MNISNFQTLNELIKSQATGSVCALSKRLNVSERTVKNMVDTLRTLCGCEIIYDFSKTSYVYLEDGSCDFIFKKSRKDYITTEVTNLLRRMLVLVPFGAMILERGTDFAIFLPQLNSGLGLDFI